MQGKPLAQIEEADLEKLVMDHVQEGLTLEFKRQLDLATPSERKEAAKDASALANTAGGRILYGIDEQSTPDGTVVAGRIVPLTNGALGDTLANVLHSTIHPRARFNLRAVPVTGGYVLVVETYPSSGVDLHMVTGYGDHRYYRRGPKGVIPMTEPEVREAYIRIGELRASLEARVEKLVRPEMETRAAVDESILIVPLYSRPSLVDPRHVGHLGVRLREGVFQRVAELRDYLSDLRLRYDGYRLLLGGDARDADLYAAILKSGVVHLSSNLAFEDTKTELHFWSLRATQRILWALLIAREVFQWSTYSGPARLYYQVRPTKPWRIEPGMFTGLKDPIQPGVFTAEISEVNLESTLGSWGGLVKDLVDPIFHAAGDFVCPHFSHDGVLLRKSAQTHFDVYKQYIQIQQA